MEMEEGTIDRRILEQARQKLDDAATLYSVSVPLITDGTPNERELAKAGLEKMAELLEEVYTALFL